MYRFKLKEIEVGDTDIKKGVKTTVSDVDPETGAITYDVENVANFSSTYNALQQAKEFLNTLEKTGQAKDDTTIDKFAENITSTLSRSLTKISAILADCIVWGAGRIPPTCKLVCFK